MMSVAEEEENARCARADPWVHCFYQVIGFWPCYRSDSMEPPWDGMSADFFAKHEEKMEMRVGGVNGRL